MADGPSVATPPATGLWRVARGDAPLAVASGDHASHANRFDALSMNYGVLYLGTDLQACFGETLARLRPSILLMALVQEEWADRGFMPVGTIPADWRHRRSAVHVEVPDGLRFLDVESPVTQQFLRTELAVGLSAMGITDLDVSTIRGPDRRVTQLISEWAYMATDGDPLARNAGGTQRVRLI